VWTVLPSQTAVTIFVVAAIVVVISIYFQRIWYMKLFAYQAPFTTTQLADGTIGVSFHEGMKGVQPTQDQSSTRGRSVDPQEP
jgi:hypothetical protein